MSPLTTSRPRAAATARPYRRGPLLPMTLAAACALAVGAGGCGTSPAATTAPSATVAATSAVSSSPAGADGCDAGLDVLSTALTYPALGPDAPPPSTEDLAAWAGRMQDPLSRFRSAAPAGIGDAIGALDDSRRQAAAGRPVDLSDPALASASTAVDEWIWDTCDFPRLDAVNTSDGLTGIPATVAAGPVSVSFENTDGATGFVLLVARVNDDVPVTVDDLVANRIDLDSAARVVMAASPGPDGQPAHSSTRLTPGRYAVVSPQGTPPTFTGYHAALITVS